MNVTVAICTWNRADLLNQTLNQMRELLIPPEVNWELLIVNNNCSDETDEVIARHADYLPIRRVFEVQQGLSRARNRVLDQARGELILWTDDDVIVDAQWLSAYVEASRQWPNVSFFGGPIKPWYEVDPPDWIAQGISRLKTAYALLDYGPITRRLEPEETPYGANMGVLAAAVQHHRFDHRLGRIGSNLISGEETVFFRRLVADGHSGLWVGSAQVRHFIPAARLSRCYLNQFFEGLGRSKVHMRETVSGRKLFGVPIWLARKCVYHHVSALTLRLMLNPNWIGAFVTSSVTRGMIRELLAKRRRMASNHPSELDSDHPDDALHSETQS